MSADRINANLTAIAREIDFLRAHQEAANELLDRRLAELARDLREITTPGCPACGADPGAGGTPGCLGCGDPDDPRCGWCSSRQHRAEDCPNIVGGPPCAAFGSEPARSAGDGVPW